MNSLTFIITTFNSAGVIDNCLNKINFNNYEVIVVDNNSSDNTTEIVSEKYKKGSDYRKYLESVANHEIF